MHLLRQRGHRDLLHRRHLCAIPCGELPNACCTPEALANGLCRNSDCENNCGGWSSWVGDRSGLLGHGLGVAAMLGTTLRLFNCLFDTRPWRPDRASDSAPRGVRESRPRSGTAALALGAGAGRGRGWRGARRAVAHGDRRCRRALAGVTVSPCSVSHRSDPLRSDTRTGAARNREWGRCP